MSSPGRHQTHRRLITIGFWLAGAAVLIAMTIAWLGMRAATVRAELNAAADLIPQIRVSVAVNKTQESAAAAKELRSHTANARAAAEDPLWTLASAIPMMGANFSAISEVARSADDVAVLAVYPLTEVFGSLNWDTLTPSHAGANLGPLQKAAPRVASAAHAVRISAERLEKIEESSLLPQVAEPLLRAQEQLREVTGVLDASADASQLLPGMLGATDRRDYLLMIQNNAEARASGGIPGALAVLTVDKGKLTLGAQSSASDVGIMSPVLAVDDEQEQIYSPRLGKFMQDVNLTPDFPTAAATAQAMWERKTGHHVDGVLSIDPVALGYLLEATGPVKTSKPEILALASGGLPTELNGENVVQTLLSDVYAKIEQPKLQDAYFAGVAQEIFAALSNGKGDAKDLIQGIARGTAEGRVLLWSASASEQVVLSKYPLSGSITGPSISPSQFGVYFNDGTGAKMDYYVKRTVQLVKECARDGYVHVKVRVSSTNTAPSDAATSLPAYVTGDGAFGVPEGVVQTNIVAYGPVQSNVDTAFLDGKKVSFGAQRHSGRPVGTVTVRLAPGEKKSVEFSFEKIVQHTEPKLSVTPTVQTLKAVALDTISTKCDPAPDPED